MAFNREQGIYYDADDPVNRVMNIKKGSPDSDKLNKVHARAKDRFALAETYELDERALSKDDLELLLMEGKHWDSLEYEERKLAKRPVFEIPLLAGMHKQVVGDLRRNSLEINIVGVDEFSDELTAEKIEGVIRNIEYDSTAKRAYMHGGKMASACSRGAWRVISEYEDVDSFYQVARLLKVDNPFTIYCDPKGNYDFEKADWGFVEIKMDKDEFERKFPGVEHKAFTGTGEYTAEAWSEDGIVRVVEYFEVEKKEKTLYKINLLDENADFDADSDEKLPFIKDPDTGEIATMNMFEDELPEFLQEAIKAKDKVVMGLFIIKKRKSFKRKVMWYLMNGVQILEYREFPCEYIPLVLTMGEDYSVVGKPVFISTIRDGKSSQKLLDLQKSSLAEFWKRAPVTQFWMTDAMTEGREPGIVNSFEKIKPFIKINVDPAFPGGLPKAVDTPEAPRSLFADMANTESQMRTAIQIFPSREGDSDPDESGVARQKSIDQSENATFFVIDNVQYGMVYTGKVLISMVKRLYTEPNRLVRMLGRDNEEITVKINTTDENAERINFTIGKYDVRVEVAPAYVTQQKEAAAQLMSIVEKVPVLAPVLVSDIIKASGVRNAGDIAQKVEAFLNPKPPENVPDNGGVGV